MRVAAAVVLPWFLWGFLENVVYMSLSVADPETFPPSGELTQTWSIVLLLVLRTGYSAAAGALAGKLGHDRTVSWAAAAVLLITGIIVQVASWELGPVWYHVLFLLGIVPAAMLAAARFE